PGWWRNFWVSAESGEAGGAACPRTVATAASTGPWLFQPRNVGSFSPLWFVFPLGFAFLVCFPERPPVGLVSFPSTAAPFSRFGFVSTRHLLVSSFPPCPRPGPPVACRRPCAQYSLVLWLFYDLHIAFGTPDRHFRGRAVYVRSAPLPALMPVPSEDD